jgi:hypothetical protein
MLFSLSSRYSPAGIADKNSSSSNLASANASVNESNSAIGAGIQLTMKEKYKKSL